MVLFLIITELKFQKKMKLNDCLFATGGKINNEPRSILIENLDVLLLIWHM